MQVKKAGVIILLLAVLSLSAIGCSNSSGSEARQSDDGRIKVTFWHAMSGSAGN